MSEMIERTGQNYLPNILAYVGKLLPVITIPITIESEMQTAHPSIKQLYSMIKSH